MARGFGSVRATQHEAQSRGQWFPEEINDEISVADKAGAQGATVILTTSATHDPAEKAIIAPPLHADARFLVHPERDPNRDPHPLIAGGRTYSSSKLCNVLTARALAAHPDTTARRLTIIAYDPGHTPQAGI